MKFNVNNELADKIENPRIGNVYPVRGGTGAKHGHMMVIVSINGMTATYLTITVEGMIVSAGNYSTYYFGEKCPIGFCDGLEGLNFNIEGVS